MGVTGLWSLLAPIATPRDLVDLRGDCLSVDLSIWLHRAIHRPGGGNKHQQVCFCQIPDIHDI